MKNEAISMTQRALTDLREKIQNCQIMPGESLSEKTLCTELNCGRTPVREALLALRGEGLIEIFPRKGIRVAPFTREGIGEIYQIRKIIEPVVGSRYYLQMDKGKLLEFDHDFEHLDREDDRAYYTLDFAFHRWLVAAAGNRRLDTFYAGVLQTQYRFSMYTSRLGTAVKGDYYREHHDIIEALLAEDPERIAKTSVAHANYSETIALRTLQQVQKQE